ncbi:MAG: N-acetyl-gamma-glutamyl-phosphate reductase [Melioribacteraceae bacterium]|nr:N-acetyl-gamma-glutamyl-phosphate reductase [Melioribacteraceae bacterium]MCO6472589.1 N-acetyl-gamma-glutamyl-phosphate reductase [Melioribacteraceae bacterium]
MLKVGIVGATGYTGSELVRLLHFHPEAEIAFITSESHKGKKFSDIHPQFRNIVDIELETVDNIDPESVDVIFLALPHGVSIEFVEKFINYDVKIIDLSGDFRLSSKSVYEEWYKKEHSFEDGFNQAVFGLPELWPEEIEKAKLVANPGCFPTGAILTTAPLVKSNLVDKSRIVIDSKTGITGAGIKAKEVTHFPNVNDNFKPYGVKFHRHTIEIQEQLSKVGNTETIIQFTPHLLPIDRGILTSAYLIPTKKITEETVLNIYKEFYNDSYFIRIVDETPEVKNVRGTNFVDIYPTYDERTNTILVFSAIDNLVKGASGEAIQNMNLMFGLKEETGLNQIPLKP